MDPAFRPRRGDRPAINQQIHMLVREMATSNPLCGAPRIHGELRILGLDVLERTVSRLLERIPRPPSQTWRTFLTNDLASAASMDFFTVPTLIGRVCSSWSYCRTSIGVLSTSTSRMIQRTWSAQQVVNACPDDIAPRWLHRDRDCIYGDAFQRRMVGLGIAKVVSAPASPWQTCTSNA